MKKPIRLTVILVFALLLAAALTVGALAVSTLSFTAPATSALAVGNSLKDCTLTGGSAADADGNAVAGAFAWKTPTKFTQAGVYYCDCVFTPTDTAKYAAQTLKVAVYVYRISLQITELPTAAPISAGQPLSDSALAGGAACNPFDRQTIVEGAFAWVDGTEVLSAAGEYERAVVFNPVDTATYNPTVVTFTRLADRSFADAAVTVAVSAAASPSPAPAAPETTETPAAGSAATAQPQTSAPTEAASPAPTEAASPAPTEAAPAETPAAGGGQTGLIVGIAAAVVVVGIGAALIAKKKKSGAGKP